MPDLVDYDPKNPPRAKLHVTAQLDRDLAVYRTGRSRVAWKAFAIRDQTTKEPVAQLAFNSDGGISVTFNLASAQERSWSLSAQALFDCVEAADKLYVAERDRLAAEKNKPVAVAKADTLRKSTKTLKQAKKAKRRMTLKRGYSGLGRL